MVKRRQRIAVLSLFVFLIGISSVSASEVAAVWTRLYERANSLSQKYHFMLNIVEQNSKDMIPVLTRALDEQVRNFENPKSTSEKQQQIRLTRMVVKELGALKAREAADLVWQVVQATDNALLKSESLLALGKMGARRYAEPMALMLRNVNSRGDQVIDTRENEILAYGLVKAFSRLKHEAGLEQVFYATDGWYSSRSGVKEAAKKALQVMTDDPSDMLERIIETNDNYKWKLAALEAERRSDAPESRKAEVAALALEKGLRLSHKNMIEKRQLKQLRLTALRSLAGLPEPDTPGLISNMERMITGYWRERLYAEDEILQLIHTLGTYDNEEVAAILVDFLGKMNKRKNDGGDVSPRIARQTIMSLGNIGSEAAIPELVRLESIMRWENSVIRQAKKAKEQIRK